MDSFALKEARFPRITHRGFPFWAIPAMAAVFFLATTPVFAANLTSQVVVAVLPAAPSNLSASANSSSQINLTWTDNSSNETGFRIERKTGSGSFSEVTTAGQNIATYLDSNLSASTVYTYRVRAYNADGNSDYSNEASTTTNAVQQQGGGGGGGGGIYNPPSATVVFRGKAYPKSSVTLLKDAQVSATVPAGPDANFEITLLGLSTGTYNFGVWAEDVKGNRSATHNFTISVTVGATTIVSGIFLPPTIALDKLEVKKGDNLLIFGKTAPQAQVTVFINSDEEIIKKTDADKGGDWLYKFDTSEIDYGEHSTRAKSKLDGDLTTFSNVLSFKVSTRNVLAPEKKKYEPKGDANKDNRINLVDFSVMAYWYKRSSPPATIDLNNDKKIDLVDFSIMAYFWTG